MHNALILHYHQSADDTNSSVAAEVFTAQLSLIKKLKMPVVSLEELVENNYKRKRWHRHVILISCTDTFLAQNPTVCETLKAAGLPVAVFIAADAGAEQIPFWQELIAAGFSLGVRSVPELSLSQLPEPEISLELAELKQRIEAATGTPVRSLLPFTNDLNKKVVTAALEVGFEAVLTRKVGYNRFNADLRCLKTWIVPPHISLQAFGRMLCRDKKELLTQELKAQALKNGRRIIEKSLLGKLKGLFSRVRV